MTPTVIPEPSKRVEGDKVAVLYSPGLPTPPDHVYPEIVTLAPTDEDGIVIPHLWWESPNWIKQPKSIRMKWSAIWIENEIIKDRKRKEKPAKGVKRPYQPRYTTQAAVNWGKRQLMPDGRRKWVLLDREHFNFKTQKHSDLEAGTDCIFDDGKEGRLAIQAAGIGERAVHWQRFQDWGGSEGAVAKAKRRGLRVLYLVFERNSPEPLAKYTEWWVE